MRFLDELKRRKVIRVAGLYLVTAWLLVQVAETLLPAFGAPGWVLRAMVLILALGFVPALVCAWVFELTPDGFRRDANVDPRSRADGNRRLDIATLIVAVLAIGLLVADRLTPEQEAVAGPETVGGPEVVGGPSGPTVPVGPEGPPTQSIAVLAFADMSPGKDNEYLGDGIAEEILNGLAKVDGLKVAGRTSSFRYKDKDVDLRDVGRELGVAHVLEGSVRRQGDQVRITAQLIRAADGFHLWSETFPGTMDDVFALQERIARSVTDELKIVLGAGQSGNLVDAGTTNVEAYTLYLEASQIFHRRQGPRLAEAEAMLKRAIELDPKFARAWARIASIRSIARNYGNTDQRTATADVEQAAQAAIAIDPTLAEPHAAMALQYSATRDYVRSRAAFEKALALEPDDVIANVWRGTSLAASGNRSEGIRYLDRALELDPLLPIALLWRGLANVTDGEVEIGERQLNLAAEGGLAFAGLGLGQLAASRGDVEEATAQFTPAFQSLAGDVAPTRIAVFARAVAGDPAARAPALAAAEDLLRDSDDVVPAIAVYVLLHLGETERAFDLIGPAPLSNDALVFGSLQRGVFPGVRTHPRFPELARQVGWAALWDAHGAPDDCSKVGDDWVCTK